MALSEEEAQRKKRRRKLATGLLLGGVAVGLPTLVARYRTRKRAPLPEPEWGEPEHVEWRGGRVAFQRLGHGDPILLVHSPGPGHDGWEWRDAARYLAARRRVLVPDLPGWGRSRGVRQSPSATLYRDFLVDFWLSEVGSGGVMVAAGLAAAWAVGTAVDLGEAVRALGLVDPTGLHRGRRHPDLSQLVLRTLVRTPGLGTSAATLFTTRSSIRRHLAQEVYADPMRVDDDLVDHYLASSRQPGAQRSLAAYLAGRLDFPVEGLLPRLEVPAWLAWGREAKNPPVERADHWLRRLPTAELAVFEGCGDRPHAEAPEAFGAELERFLEGLTR